MSHSLSWCDFIAGWSGGVLGLAVGHPLDTLKVRQQTLPGRVGIVELTKATYKLEGVSVLLVCITFMPRSAMYLIHAALEDNPSSFSAFSSIAFHYIVNIYDEKCFFKGLAYPLLGAGIYNALFFGVYGNCLRHMQGVAKGENIRKMCCERETPDSNWHRDVFIAGCIGGVATVLYSCPLDVIKIKLQAQTAKKTKRSSSIGISEPIYQGPFDALKGIYKNYGVMNGLYKGLWTMMWRDVPTFGIYTLSYEHILCLFKEKGDRSPNATITSQVVAGGIAGVLSWVLVIPLDVIKSKLQADDFGQPLYSGMVDCFKKLYHHEGVKALFLGTTLMTLRAFPVNAATFIGYEYTIKLCDDWGPKLMSGFGRRDCSNKEDEDVTVNLLIPEDPPEY